jgi:outer membrane protein assembly factor BamB/tetratricopeptide (TPR) repeat protein
MNQSNGILNSEEVEFLLDSASASSEDSMTPGDSQGVTMHGDLEQMSLADIFQTLGMAKMEGLLKVSNPVEQRMVHFRGGMVRILVPSRAATRRLGQRLIQVGLLDPEHLRMALLEQRREKNAEPLGQILVRGGYVPQDQVNELVHMQVTEELFGLFTWEQGEFEFYRGPVQDPSVQERVDECPEFDVNSLLLEVARRADEWEDILLALRSLDEVPLPTDASADHKGMTEDHHTVLSAVDCRATYRELSDATCMSLFDCARAARDLMHWGMITAAEDEHMLDVARWHREQGHDKKALMLAKTLRDRPGERSVAIIREMAQLVRETGETRIASHIVLHAAQVQPDAQLALELAREARALSPRDLDALQFLRTTLLRQHSGDAPEIEQITRELIDGMLHDGDTDGAAALLDEVHELDSMTPALLVCEGRLQAKTRHNEQAVETFLQAADAFAVAGDARREVECLELAARLDRERKDISRRLRQRKTTPRARIIRIGSYAAASLTLLAAGAVWFEEQNHQQQIADATTEISSQLVAQDLQAAQVAMSRWREAIGDCSHLDDLEQQIRFAVVTEKRLRRKAASRLAADRLQTAGELLLQGDLAAAYAIYDELAGNPDLTTEVHDAARTRFGALLRDFDDTIRDLSAGLPTAPDALMQRTKIEETYTRLSRRVPERLITAIRMIQEQQRTARLPRSLSAEKLDVLGKAIATAAPLLDAAHTRLEQYRAATERYDSQRRLDPLFKSALAHERSMRFPAALQAYRQLMATGTGSAALREHLADKVSQLEGILGMIELIDAATAAGDYHKARRELTALQAAEPDIPFDSFVRLPVRIETAVPGATISWNGEDIGRTPKLVSYIPAGEHMLELKLPGCEPLRQPLPTDHGGVFRPLLAVSPSWSTETTGTDRKMVVDLAGRIFSAERDGGLRCYDIRNGQLLWQHRADDISAWLTSPVLIGELVVTASLDGPLRAFDARTGKIRWQIDDLPTEHTPVISSGLLALATRDGGLQLVSPNSAEVVARVELLEVAHRQPVGIDGVVFVPLRDDTIAAVETGRGEVRWRSRPGAQGSMLATCRQGLLALRDDGQLSLLSTADGRPRWSYALHATPTGLPDVDADQVLVTVDDRVLLLDTRDGTPRWSIDRAQHSWASPARFLSGQCAVPTREGGMLLFEPGADLPRSVIRTDGDVSLCGSAGSYALAASGRSLEFFRKLP